jgi:hypothetical protein
VPRCHTPRHMHALLALGLRVGREHVPYSEGLTVVTHGHCNFWLQLVATSCNAVLFRTMPGTSALPTQNRGHHHSTPRFLGGRCKQVEGTRLTQ